MNKNDITTILTSYLWLIIAYLLLLIMFMAVSNLTEKRLEKYIKTEFQVMPEDVHRVAVETQKSLERIEKILTEQN